MCWIQQKIWKRKCSRKPFSPGHQQSSSHEQGGATSFAGLHRLRARERRFLRRTPPQLRAAAPPWALATRLCGTTPRLPRCGFYEWRQASGTSFCSAVSFGPCTACCMWPCPPQVIGSWHRPTRLRFVLLCRWCCLPALRLASCTQCRLAQAH